MKPVATCTHAFLTLDAASILFSGSDWLIGRAYVSYDWFTFYGLSLPTLNFVCADTLLSLLSDQPFNPQFKLRW